MSNDIRYITVDVSKDGETTVEAHNFDGPDCMKATEFLTKALGKSVESTKKPDFFKKAVQYIKQKVTQ